MPVKMERVGVKSGWRNCVRQRKFFTRRREKEGGCRRKVEGRGRGVVEEVECGTGNFLEGCRRKVGWSWSRVAEEVESESSHGERRVARDRWQDSGPQGGRSRELVSKSCRR